MKAHTQKIVDLTARISHLVASDNKCEVHFEWLKTEEGNPHLQCFTVHPFSRESFLLKRVSGEDEVECLEKILSFLEDKEKMKDMGYETYKVEWHKEGHDATQKSYFYCKSVQEVLMKFFEGGKDPSKYKIYVIEMMPSA